MRSNDPAGLEAYGNAILIQTESESILDRLTTQLVKAVPGIRPLPRAPEKGLLNFRVVPEPHDRVSIFESGEPVARNVSIEFAVDQICTIARIKVAEYAVGMTFIHAGVVALRDKAVVLPAQSYKGKTSLVAELVRMGATYFSDEYAVFDREGNVHPFAKPLSVREVAGSHLQTERDVEEFGGHKGIGKAEVGLVLFTEYVPGAIWSPRKLTPAAAVLEMIRHCVPIRRDPEFTLETLRTVANLSPAYATQRGETKAASRNILDILEGGVWQLRPDPDRSA